jgi:glutamine synthetase
MESASKLTDSINQHDFSSIEDHLQFCAKTIRPLMDEVRDFADLLEGICSDELWPYPTYQEMLFIK